MDLSCTEDDCIANDRTDAHVLKLQMCAQSTTTHTATAEPQKSEKKRRKTMTARHSS